MKANVTPRDKTRRPESKRRALSRRADRAAKSARLFLAFAFPADLDSLTPTAA